MARQRIGAEIRKSDFDELLKNMDKFSKDLRVKVANEIEITGLEIETDAKMRCPFVTGRLRASIKSLFDREKISCLVGTNVEYAQAVEFGGKNRKAKPFLYPAYFENIGKLYDRIKKIINGI